MDLGYASTELGIILIRNTLFYESRKKIGEII